MSTLHEVVLPDGSKRKLGNKIPKLSLKAAYPVVGSSPDRIRQIPRSEWDALLKEYDSLDEFDPTLDKCYVHDQDGVGQCNADATALAIEYTRVRQGLPFVKLSAADLYDRINGGVDEGSMLEDGVREAMARGIGTAETCGLVWRKQGWKGPAPDSERSLYAVPEAYLCPTFDDCFSAVLQGFAIISGILWYDNFNPGADGWLPSRGTGRPGGHAICGYKPTKATQHGETFGIWHQNSWSPQWGYKGRMVLNQSNYGSQIGGWWAVRTVTDQGVRK